MLLIQNEASLLPAGIPNISSNSAPVCACPYHSLHCISVLYRFYVDKCNRAV